MSTILLTGFAPFGDNKINPSQQIAERLDGETIGGARVVGLTLPVVFGEDTGPVFAALAEHHPALVLLLGLNAGATCLDVERFAVNLRDTDRDTDGDTGRQGPVLDDGFAALLATIDTEGLAQAIRETGVPARAHGYAGAYLCNHVLYQTLHYVQQWSLNCKAGFIHLPLSTEQVIAENRLHQPSLPLELMVTGVRAALAACVPAR